MTVRDIDAQFEEIIEVMKESSDYSREEKIEKREIYSG